MNQKQTSELLFSYGTLRYESVQLATFGRKLEGRPDALVGFRLSKVKITDPKVLAASGDDEHPILLRSDHASDEVEGMVFEVSPRELEQADEYEVADYKRIAVTLRSGSLAWVYVSVEDQDLKQQAAS